MCICCYMGAWVFSWMTNRMFHTDDDTINGRA